MAFIKIDRNSFELSSLTLRPRVHFISSSVDGTVSTGSAYVIPQRSKVIKDPVRPYEGVNANGTIYLSQNTDGYDEADYAVIEMLKGASDTIRGARRQGIFSSDISGYMSRYMEAVNDAPLPATYDKKLDVFTFAPPVRFTKNSSIKNNIRKVLMPYHRVRYDSSAFEYTNYNCLNFFTGSNFPTGSCLIYPNHSQEISGATDSRLWENIYTPNGPFTFDFWINPRYGSTTYKDGNGNIRSNVFHAGTIFHMSSTLAVSLVSGSSKDMLGRVDGYRLLVQLSQSADTPPSKISMNEALLAPKNLIFSSSDNLLKRNHWHHVTVKWGTTNYNNGTGSIQIDDHFDYFYVPSSSLATSGSDAIFIGNYYDGPNNEYEAPADCNIAMFFNANAALNEGVTDWNDGAYTNDPTPSKYNMSHPLNAEVHDLKLYNKWLTNDEVSKIKKNGPTQYGNGLMFYVPPFFQKETRTREVLVTPFQKIRSTTDDPFNVSFSFGVGGKLINLENFTREFVKGEFPRLFYLTASEITKTIENITADEYIYGTIPQSKLTTAGVAYSSGSALKRNFTILPCDNGQFAPNYFPLVSGSRSTTLTPFLSPPNNAVDYTSISLENLIPTSSLFEGLIFQTGSIFDQVVGASPENPGVPPGAVLTIAQRTRDVSSNEITVFDISNLYYGNRILPGSFQVKDENLTGSQGRIQITYKDNGKGGLYRADSDTKHATWANCGNIFYDEGIAIVKSPNTLYFSKDSTNMKFRGQQNSHIMTINAFCPKTMFNSSSNPQYKLISASLNANDENSEFVYITGINIHDDNLNVIMRANLAQPIVKRKEDGYLFKIKKDF
jgi:hypothetical protein